MPAPAPRLVCTAPAVSADPALARRRSFFGSLATALVAEFVSLIYK
jgi:hypothetical protein